jgi:hypothetical protein
MVVAVAEVEAVAVVALL